MKIGDFKKILVPIIKQIVKEEVQIQLPKLLFEMVDRNTNNNGIVKENNSVVKPVSQKQEIYTPPVVKQQKNYVKDPILNQILNETTPGLPQSPYGAGVDLEAEGFQKVGVVEDDYKNIQQILNENVNMPQSQPPMPVVDNISETTLTAPPNLFNKNFKAILEKSKKGKFGFSNKVSLG